MVIQAALSLGSLPPQLSQSSKPSRSADLMALSSLSQVPPKWGACGGFLKGWALHVVSCSWRAELNWSKTSCSSLSPLMKWVPWSEMTLKKVPCWATKQQNNIRNLPLCILKRKFTWMQRVVRLLKTIPYVFSCQQPTLMEERRLE